MTTSCCPSYIELVNKHVPEMEKYVSSTRSPMYYTARIAKKKYPDAKVVFVGHVSPSARRPNVTKKWTS